MLRGIPPFVSPDLLKILAEMGHGDDLVIGDANFPAASLATRLVRLDGHRVVAILEAILALMPLDDFVPHPVRVMRLVGEGPEPLAHQQIRGVVAAWDQRPAAVTAIDRPLFYEQARRAYAVVATGEPLLYSCLVVTKGVLRPTQDGV